MTSHPKYPLWAPLEQGKRRGVKGTRKRLPPEVIKRLHRARPGEPSFICEDCGIKYSPKVMREWKEHIFTGAKLLCKWCWETRCGKNLEYEKLLRTLNRR